MFHIAFTPNASPANAMSAKAETLMGAIADLLKSLGSAFGSEEWFVVNVLEALKEAIDNMEDCQPAKGTWTDMGCEDDAFSIDIFCADDAKYVKLDDDYLLAPHGAVALGIGKHNHQEWIYDEADVAEWDSVLRPIYRDLPDDGLDAAVRSVVDPKIVAITREEKLGDCTLTGTFEDGSQCKLFSFYVDELSFSDSDLIGKTETEAHHLHQQRMVAYLQA